VFLHGGFGRMRRGLKDDVMRKRGIGIFANEIFFIGERKLK